MATSKPKEKQTYLRSKSLVPSSQKSLKQPISPRSTGAATSADPKDKPSTNSTDKSVPSYLRPTLSTRSESLKYVKKSSVDDPNIARRRSFDRPLTTAPRVNKSVVSPDTRERPKLREKVTTTIKSSSFPAKPITNAPKPTSDKATVKTSTGNKAGKMPSRVVNKGSSSNKVAVVSSASKKTRVTRVVRDRATRNENKGSDGDSASVVDEVVDLESSVKKEQVVDTVDSEVENEEQEEKMKSDVSTISEEENLSETAHIEDQIGEEEDEINKNEETENQIRDSDEEVIDGEPPEEMESIEQAKTEGEENKSDNPIEEAEIEQENLDAKTEKDSSGEDIADDAKIIDDVVEENIKSPKESGESVEEHVHEEEVKIETAAPTLGGKRFEGQGRKESPGAYNDVIEECANKFLEKKKNKVKALVGAFETVIDYESK